MTSPTIRDQSSDNASVTFTDRSKPDLKGGNYVITINHDVSGNGVTSDTSSLPPTVREFNVRAPRFSLDPKQLVHSALPPGGSTSDCRLILPHLSLTQKTLPWAQHLMDSQPSQHSVDGGEMNPWLALLMFRAGELPDDPGATGTTKVRKVSDVLNSQAWGGEAVGPLIDSTAVAADVLGGECRTVDVPADVFYAVAPRLSEVGCLAHVRSVRKEQGVRSEHGRDVVDDAGEYSVVIGNRLPTDWGTYVCHLVSLEGHVGHLTPDSVQLPLRLVSLYSWSFACASDGGTSFQERVEALAKPGESAGALDLALRLPFTKQGSSAADNEAGARMGLGYVPILYSVDTGEKLLSWYRGPLTPQAPQSVSPLTTAQGGSKTSAENLLIYNQDHAVFDVSYSAAWTLGRLLGISRSTGRNGLSGLYEAARRTMNEVVARLSTPTEITGVDSRTMTTPEALADATPARSRLFRQLAEHYGTSQVREETAGPAELLPPGAAGVAAALERDEVRTLLRERVSHAAESTADFFDALRLLRGIPFNYLVPDGRLIPQESIRFFYIDKYWISALLDGALHTGISTDQDKEVVEFLRECVMDRMEAKYGAQPAVGALIRSRLVTDYPGLVVEGRTSANTLVPLTRQEVIAPGLMMALLEEIPAKLALRVPPESLMVGFTSDIPPFEHNRTLQKRYVTDQEAKPHNKKGGEIIDGGAINADLYIGKRADLSADVVDISRLAAAASSSAYGTSSAVLAMQLCAEPPFEIDFTPPAGRISGEGERSQS